MIQEDAGIALQFSMMGGFVEDNEDGGNGGVTLPAKTETETMPQLKLISTVNVMDQNPWCIISKNIIISEARKRVKVKYNHQFQWIVSLFMLHQIIAFSQMLHGVSSFQLYNIPHRYDGRSTSHSSSILKFSDSEEFSFASNDDEEEEEDVDFDLYGPPSFASHQRSYAPSTGPGPGTRSGSTTPTPTRANNARKRIIWIIDDEQPILDAVGSYLTSVGGYEVYPFLNATLPLALLSQTTQSQSLLNGSTSSTTRSRSNNDPDENDRNLQIMVPDAIISDVRMPHISGIDLLTMIRSSTINSILNMPFILLTARSLVEDRVRGYDAGTDGYLTKPFDPEELVVLLERMIQRKEWMEDSTTQSSVSLEELKEDLDEIKEALSKEEANLFLLNSSSSKGKLRVGGKVDQNSQGIENEQYDLNYSYSDDYHDDDDDETPLLDPDEMDVLELLCQGYMNKEIAFELQYSIRWVEIRLTAMYKKTGCANRTELVRWAIANDFVDM